MRYDSMIGGGQAKYQKVGMLKLDFGHKDVSGYSRQLDLNDAVASSTYTTGGKQFTRETFISNPDQVMVTRIRCNTGGSVSFSAYYADILGGGGVTDGNDTLVANGHGDSDCGVAGAVYFSARTKLIPKGGTVSAANGRIQVSGADEVLILTTVRTNYVDSKTCNADEKKRICDAAGGGIQLCQRCADRAKGRRHGKSRLHPRRLLCGLPHAGFCIRCSGLFCAGGKQHGKRNNRNPHRIADRKTARKL
jgi:hypothetical protein